jgi:hypothetical protein
VARAPGYVPSSLGLPGDIVFFQVLAEHVRFLGVFLSWFIVFVGHTAVMHRLGAMYFENRRGLGWNPDSPRNVRV